MGTEDLEQKVVEHVAEQLLGLLSENVFRIGGMIAVGVLISILWTEFKKAEIRDLDGGNLEDPTQKWRIRKWAFWTGTIPASILLAVFLPSVITGAPLWADILLRMLFAGMLGPIAGLLSPVAWLFLVKAVWPLIRLAWQALANYVASKVFGRSGQVKETAGGELGFKPDAVPGAPHDADPPKTEILGGPRTGSDS